MIKADRMSQTTSQLLIGIAIVAGLYGSSRYDYLLFHTLVELFSVLTAFVIFALAWHTRKIHDNHYLLFLGIASLCTGALDLAHTLTYKGIGVFPDRGANPPTQFWIAFRSVFSVSFLLSTFYINKKLHPQRTIVLYALVFSILTAAVFLGWFPDCYRDGTGLTDFKIVSEYVICAVFLGALGLLIRKRSAFDPLVFRLMALSLVFSIAAEVSFTEYASVYGFANMVGHLFLLASVALIYRAIVVTGVVEPSRLLFRNLKLSEEAIRASETKYRLLFENMINAFAYHRVVTDQAGKPVDYVFLEVNDAFGKMTGLKRADIVGRGVREVLPGIEKDPADWIGRYGRVALEGKEERFDQYAAPLKKWYSVLAYSPVKEYFVTIFEDITERKQADAVLFQKNQEIALANGILEVFVKESGDGMYDKVLDLVLERMESRYGVFGYIDEQGVLVCPTMSRIFDQCEMEGKCILYPRSKWKGLWSRALLEKKTLFTNEQAAVPKGHVPIMNNIATPILFQDNVIGLFNLANKDTDYTEEDRNFLEAVTGRIAPVLYAWVQKEMRENERKRSEAALQYSLRRFELLAQTAGRLLQASEPQKIIDSLCKGVMDHLDCHSFFNFLVDEQAGRLHLNAYSGISDGEASGIEWLDFGATVCGCVARDGCRIIAERVQTTADERTQLIKSLGMNAYACHPIPGPDGKVIGTLSFGARNRETFSDDDISLMKAVTDQVAVAMIRMKDEQALRRAHDELEQRVRQRTAELARTNEDLEQEITVRRETERRISLTNELLKLYTRKFSRKEYLDVAVELIREWSGCQHAGVRIADPEGNIPFEACAGYTADFLSTENMLSVKRDDCICIRVARGDEEPSEIGAVTAMGSVYSNAGLPFGEGQAGAPGARYRTACSRSGFQSLAVVPITHRDVILGTIHVADERAGRMPVRNVEFIEQLAVILGEALFRFTIEEDLLRQREELSKINEQLRNLTAHVDAVREGERTSIAREIHDELGQVLTAIKMDVSWIGKRLPAEQGRLADKTEETLQMIDSAIQSVKRISSELRPGVLDDIGLAAAIEWAAKNFQQRTGIRSKISIHPESMTVDRMRSTALFRILQESFTNIIRHAKATRVEVSLQETKGNILLTVKDNGKGITKEEARSPHAFGLIGMRERVQFLGGQVSITGAQNRGTTVNVSLPVDSAKGTKQAD